MCQRPVSASRLGSLTGWIFGGSCCECKSSGSIKSLSSNRSAVGTHFDDVNSPNFGERYQTLSILGKGGMATVYKVRDKEDGSFFAAKVLDKSFATDELKVKRFIQEAMAVSILEHENIAKMHSYGECPDKSQYLIMEFIDGKTLADQLKEQFNLPPHEALDIFILVCFALEYAHSKGIIHRDLKPSNIIVGDGPKGEYVVKLVDFGIAKVLTPSVRETVNLTESGEIFGSPAYMSPEQCLGYQCDARSDVYSLGCLMYEALTGIPPFAQENPVQVIVQHLSREPKKLNYTIWNRFPKSLDHVILKALAKDPANRYQTVCELRQDLERIRDGRQLRINLIKKRLPRQFALFPLIAAVDLLLFFGIFQQYEKQIDLPLRAGEVVSRTDTVCQQFEDALSALESYRLTKNDNYSKTCQTASDQIASEVEAMRNISLNEKTQNDQLSKIIGSIQSKVQLLNKAIKAIELDSSDTTSIEIFEEIKTVEQELKGQAMKLMKISGDRASFLHLKLLVLLEVLILMAGNFILISWLNIRQREELQSRIWKRGQSDQSNVDIY
jgi:serine/threonine protein kinase